MGRRLKGWWDEGRGVWYASLGEVSPKTGRPKPVILCDEQGEPIRRDDEAGRDGAIARAVGKREDPTGPTVFEVVKAYVAWHKSQGSAPRTIHDHWFHLRRFALFSFGGVRYADRPARDIVPKDLWRYKKSGKGAMRQTYMSVLACWAWASVPIEDREPEVMIPSNPLAGIKRPRRGPPSGAMLWPDARRMIELARRWVEIPARTRRARTRVSRWLLVECLAMIAHGGPRTAEAVTLEWDDIRWDEGVAVIPRTRHKTGRRTQKDRHFPITSAMVPVLREIERHPDRHPRYVFAPRWSKPSVRGFWRRLRLDLKPWLASEGMELPKGWKPYWLRHGFAVTAIPAVGADETSKAMGNSAKVASEVYDHVEWSRVKGVGDAVERTREGKG